MRWSVKRREFIGLVGGAVAWPLDVHAQQPAMPMIGYLSGRSPDKEKSEVTAFRNGLEQSGYTEERNVAIVYRWADEQYNRLPALASDLVRLEVTVVMAAGNVAARAAK